MTTERADAPGYMDEIVSVTQAGIDALEKSGKLSPLKKRMLSVLLEHGPMPRRAWLLRCAKEPLL